ncbi:MAG: hypothetical protein BWY71_01777 [Planctomycetes bacterium ADurb.Bin412]|nr:MAG: hypothetical protein BWY71_01777 [Planctomycetes bacterium ADurb.Bin412]
MIHRRWPYLRADHSHGNHRTLTAVNHGYIDRSRRHSGEQTVGGYTSEGRIAQIIGGSVGCRGAILRGTGGLIFAYDKLTCAANRQRITARIKFNPRYYARIANCNRSRCGYTLGGYQYGGNAFGNRPKHAVFRDQTDIGIGRNVMGQTRRQLDSLLVGEFAQYGQAPRLIPIQQKVSLGQLNANQRRCSDIHGNMCRFGEEGAIVSLEIKTGSPGKAGIRCKQDSMALAGLNDCAVLQI